MPSLRANLNKPGASMRLDADRCGREPSSEKQVGSQRITTRAPKCTIYTLHLSARLAPRHHVTSPQLPSFRLPNVAPQERDDVAGFFHSAIARCFP